MLILVIRFAEVLRELKADCYLMLHHVCDTFYYEWNTDVSCMFVASHFPVACCGSAFLDQYYQVMKSWSTGGRCFFS